MNNSSDFKEDVYQISEKKILKEAININFSYFQIQNYDIDILTRYFGKVYRSRLVNNYHFIYIPSRVIYSYCPEITGIGINNINNINIYMFALSVEEKIEKLFRFRKTYLTLKNELALAKNINIDDKKNKEVYNSIPYKKLERLQILYNSLKEFILQSLSNLVNTNISIGETNPTPIEELFVELLPSVLKLKRNYEERVLKDELPQEQLMKLLI